MNYDTVKLEEKIIVGISEQASNADPAMGETMGALWTAFIGTDLSEKIENKTSDFPICLYSNYKNTQVPQSQLEYQVTLGHEVSLSTSKELTSQIIPSGTYAKFMVQGSAATSVIEAWQQIWQLPLDRSYTGDFEEYYRLDGDQIEFAIYIALK